MLAEYSLPYIRGLHGKKSTRMTAQHGSSYPANFRHAVSYRATDTFTESSYPLTRDFLEKKFKMTCNILTST